jgi:hypothetical protein
MSSHRRGSFGFRCVQARPNDTYYAELRVGVFRLTLMYDAPELAVRAYDAAAWRFQHPRRDLNFPDVESLEEAEFFTPPSRLLDDEDRHSVAALSRHRRARRGADASMEGSVRE